MKRRDRVRGPALAALAAGVAVLVGVAGTQVGGEDEPAAPAGADRSGVTAAVRRTTLVEREEVDGTVRYADPRTVVHRLQPASRFGSGGASATPPGGSGATGAGSATITGLAAEGSVVRRGEPLYRANGRAVILMYGSVPVFRDLREGVVGEDVRQLEHNLAGLGFDPGVVDREFTAVTAEAVREWQGAAGLPETGAVRLGRVAFLPGARRVAARRLGLGQPLEAGGEVLVTSSTRQVVSVSLEARLQPLVRQGERVRVTLPGGRTVRGRIRRIGRLARDPAGESGSEPGPASGASTDAEPLIELIVTPARNPSRFDQAPVRVAIARARSRRVLAVPVGALLARAGGDFAVELASGRLMGVRAGVFANGLVEVSGSGLREGQRVVVAG